MIYQDKEGVQIEAIQLTGPTLLNTKDGEISAEAGQYLLSITKQYPIILDASVFEESFTLIG